MGQKSANRFVLGTKRTGKRSHDRRQYGLSIDTRGINGLRTGDDRQSRLLFHCEFGDLKELLACLIVSYSNDNPFSN